MEQLDIFELMTAPAFKQYFTGIKTTEAYKVEMYDWTGNSMKKKKLLMQYIYKDRPTSYACHYCGADTIYRSHKKTWWCLVDDNWECIQTFCDECVNGSVGAEYTKKKYYNSTFRAVNGILKDIKEPRRETTSLVRYTKRTRKVLLKNRDNFHMGLFSAKPYWVKNNLHFSSEEQIKIDRKQWHLRYSQRSKKWN